MVGAGKFQHVIYIWYNNFEKNQKINFFQCIVNHNQHVVPLSTMLTQKKVLNILEDLNKVTMEE